MSIKRNFNFRLILFLILVFKIPVKNLSVNLTEERRTLFVPECIILEWLRTEQVKVKRKVEGDNNR